MATLSDEKNRSYPISEEGKLFLSRFKVIREEWADRNGNKSPVSTTEGALNAADIWAKHPALAANKI